MLSQLRQEGHDHASFARFSSCLKCLSSDDVLSRFRSRGLYFLTTNRNSPYARGKNFTTNTVLPAESLEAEDGATEPESTI